MIKSILIFSLIFLYSCEDVSTRRRASSSSDRLSTDSSTYTDDRFNTVNNSNSDDTTNNGNSSTGTITTPSDVSSDCKLSNNGTSGFGYTNNLIGDFSICVSSGSNTTVYFQLKSGVQDAQVCFIPTTNSGNVITYIGGPVCQYVTDNSVKTFNIIKNRVGYTGSAMTGVLIMKNQQVAYPSPYAQTSGQVRYLNNVDAYYLCTQYREYYNISQYCQAFDSVGQYVYHQF